MKLIKKRSLHRVASSIWWYTDACYAIAGVAFKKGDMLAKCNDVGVPFKKDDEWYAKVISFQCIKATT